MTDIRSAATVQADLDLIGYMVTDLDLGEAAGGFGNLAGLYRAKGIDRIEFTAPDGTVIAAVESQPSIPAVGLRRAVIALAKAVEDQQDRHYVEAAKVVASDVASTLRIAVVLTPATVTLPGIEQGLYGIERLQLFEMAHRTIDAETLPAEQAEAVHKVREMLA